MQDQIKVHVTFTKEHEGMKFTDALIMSMEEFNKVTPEELEVLKQQRLDNWVAVINTKPEAVEPTKEDLQAQEASLDEQIAQLQSQKVVLASKLDSISVVEVKPIIKGVVK